ncbi:MAG: family transposase [Nocardioides sp.]|nr:family transposase [Nocardioides sp.]
MPVDVACRVLGVSRQGYCRYKRRPLSATQMRRHGFRTDPRDPRRVPKYLPLSTVPRRAHDRDEGLGELATGVGTDDTGRDLRPTRPAARQATQGRSDRRGPGEPQVPSTTSQRVLGHRLTEHPTREGKVFCAAGWSVDTRQDSTLVVNALDMAIRNRRPEPAAWSMPLTGVQFTSWAFGERIRTAGLLPSFGNRRRLSRQRDDGELLVLDADRATQSPQVEDPGRARERDLA